MNNWTYLAGKPIVFVASRCVVRLRYTFLMARGTRFAFWVGCIAFWSTGVLAQTSHVETRVEDFRPRTSLYPAQLNVSVEDGVLAYGRVSDIAIARRDPDGVYRFEQAVAHVGTSPLVLVRGKLVVFPSPTDVFVYAYRDGSWERVQELVRPAGIIDRFAIDGDRVAALNSSGLLVLEVGDSGSPVSTTRISTDFYDGASGDDLDLDGDVIASVSATSVTGIPIVRFYRFTEDGGWRLENEREPQPAWFEISSVYNIHVRGELVRLPADGEARRARRFEEPASVTFRYDATRSRWRQELGCFVRPEAASDELSVTCGFEGDCIDGACDTTRGWPRPGGSLLFRGVERGATFGQTDLRAWDGTRFVVRASFDDSIPAVAVDSQTFVGYADGALLVRTTCGDGGCERSDGALCELSLECMSGRCVDGSCGGSMTDAGMPDSAADSGPADSGLDDSGPDDSGPEDSGPDDSGPDDSGPDDSDSGSVDSGVTDGGTDSGASMDDDGCSVGGAPPEWFAFVIVVLLRRRRRVQNSWCRRS